MRILRFLALCALMAIFINGYGADAPKMRRICLSSNDSIATIFWLPSAAPCATFVNYKLYGREDISQVFSLLDSSTPLSNVSISRKLPNLKKWQFFVVAHFNCSGDEFYNSDTLFIDDLQPTPWDLDSVSVNLSSSWTIAGWQKHDTLDVQGYYIYKIVGTNQFVADTNSYFYEAKKLNPFLGPVKLALSAYDSCRNASAIGPNHTTIFLQPISVDTCKKELSYTFSAYLGWPVKMYYLFSRENNGAYSIIDSFVGGSASYNLKLTFPDFGKKYDYFIRAVKNAPQKISSTSNSISINISAKTPPSDLYLNRVTDNGNVIETRLTYDPANYKEINNIILQKSSDGLAFSDLNTFGKSPTGQLKSADFTTGAITKINYYRYIINGLCNAFTLTSNISNNIVLNAIPSPGNNISLTWNAYSFWKAGVLHYEVLNGVSNLPVSTWNIISTNPPNSTTHIAPFDNLKPCYCIRAIDGLTNAQPKDTSYSNIACSVGQPVVYFPNTINPGGNNGVFKPISLYIDNSASSFEVYNRWGQIIFRTNNVNAGWDGKDNNGVVYPDGIYIYKAIIKGTDNSLQELKGIITLLQ